VSVGKKLLFPVVLVLALALAVAAYQFHARRVAAAALQAKPVELPMQGDLRQLMQSRVHAEYTYLSFTIWHDQPLTPEKMDGIAASSGRIVAISGELNSYVVAYRKQGWSVQDVKFFDDKRLQLNRVAEELRRAAQKRDSSQVTSFFMHLDSTCQSCHKRFRPDLSWT
jgi:Cytochrome C'